MKSDERFSLDERKYRASIPHTHSPPVGGGSCCIYRDGNRLIYAWSRRSDRDFFVREHRNARKED